MKRISTLIIVFFLSVFNLIAENGYYIKDYDVNIKINESNQYTVAEKIVAYFQVPKRGIIRSIPSRYGNRNLKLSDVKVSGYPYSIENFSNGVSVRIGDPDIYLREDHAYNIYYSYDLGWDKNSEYDEVYYNIIGNEWDTSINRVTFKIELPKEFDRSKVKFKTGEYGSTEDGMVVWDVKGNTITGYTTEPLSPGEALTIALPLPEDYFSVYKPIFILNLIKYGLNILSILLLISAILIWLKFGKNDPVIETVEFYPPDGMTPSQLGYFIDAKIDEKDITSLIFYWADKGLLTIEEKEQGGMFKKAEYYLIKNREITSKNSYEQFLFQSLFSFSENGKLWLESLKNRFYPYIQRTASLLQIDLASEGPSLYRRDSIFYGGILKFLALVLVLLGAFGIAFENDLNLFSPDVLSAIFVLPVMYPIVTVVAVILLVVGMNTKKRTDGYNKLLGRVRGFKNFLFTAEKDKLEALLEENPQYFYNILPYTIVLGVSEKWADKFKDLVRQPPQWYTSNNMNTFNMMMFMNSFNRTLGSMRGTMYSVPPTNRGPGRSSMGGGSAGGGAGGGGGSSW